MRATEVLPGWHLEAAPEPGQGDQHRVELVGPGARRRLGEGSTGAADFAYDGRYQYGFEVALYATPEGLEVVQVDHSSHEYGGDREPRERRQRLDLGPRAAERTLLHRLNRPLDGGDSFSWQLATHPPYLEGASRPALVDDFRRLELDLPDAVEAELFGDPGVWIVRVRRGDGSAQSFRARRPLRVWSPCQGPWESMSSAGPVARWTRGAA